MPHSTSAPPTERDLFGFGPGTTSEERCGIMPQPPPVCLSITPPQEKVIEALGYLLQLRDCTAPVASARLVNLIEDHLRPVEAELEEVRNQCAALRAWGTAWKRRAKMELEISMKESDQRPTHS
ncbi:MAG: hypothetical protein WC718_00005 [Phycisphaerales bacterium]|jgi:hypothetical protein